jgi:hypothetical protein
VPVGPGEQNPAPAFSIGLRELFRIAFQASGGESLGWRLVTLGAAGLSACEELSSLGRLGARLVEVLTSLVAKEAGGKK